MFFLYYSGSHLKDLWLKWDLWLNILLIDTFKERGSIYSAHNMHDQGQNLGEPNLLIALPCLFIYLFYMWYLDSFSSP